MSPVTHHAKAKLRALYEVMPMAMLVEAAGGVAVDENGDRVLDRTVKGMDERMGFSCGEKEHMQQFLKTVYHRNL